MKYQEFIPTNGLEKYVEAFWSYADLSNVTTEKILPDGCTDIIFNLGAATQNIPSAMTVVSGMMTTYSENVFYKNTCLIGVRFKRGQLSALTHLPIFEITNQLVAINEVIPAFSGELVDQLQSQNNDESKFELISSKVFEQLVTNKITPDHLVQDVTAYIDKSNGPINLKHLSLSYHISQRQLERRFKHSIGITAKEYINIVRFNKTKKAIINNPHTSLAQLAFEYGYYDHAHLSNDIKRFAGENPSFLR